MSVSTDPDEPRGLPIEVPSDDGPKTHYGWIPTEAERTWGWTYAPPVVACYRCAPTDQTPLRVVEATVVGGLNGLIWSMACDTCGAIVEYPAGDDSEEEDD